MFLTLNTTRSIRALERIFSEQNKMAFTRFGDGEIMMMEGWGGKETNHINNLQLQQELLDAFQIKDKNYLIGINCGQENEEGMDWGLFGRFSNDDNLKQSINACKTRDTFLNATTLQYLAVFKPQMVLPFLRQLRVASAIVGGKHLRKAMGIFQADTFVEIPETNAYYKIDEYWDKIPKQGTILFGAGICTQILIKRLYQYNNIKLIDIGSLFDALLDIKSREWIERTQIHKPLQERI